MRPRRAGSSGAVSRARAAASARASRALPSSVPGASPGDGPAGRGHGRGQVTGALRVGTAEHRPPPRRIAVALGLEHGQHPAAGGQAGREPRHRGQVGQRPAGDGRVAGRAGAAPVRVHRSSASAAPGPKASTGTRQPASDTRPRRAGTGAAGATEPPGAPGAPGASGRTSSGEASGPPPADGSRRVSSSWTALRTASPAAVLADPGDPAAACRPARRPGRRTDAAGQVHARRRGRGPRRQVRVLGPQAERPWLRARAPRPRGLPA